MWLVGLTSCIRILDEYTLELLIVRTSKHFCESNAELALPFYALHPPNDHNLRCDSHAPHADDQVHTYDDSHSTYHLPLAGTIKKMTKAAPPTKAPALKRKASR